MLNVTSGNLTDIQYYANIMFDEVRTVQANQIEFISVDIRIMVYWSITAKGWNVAIKRRCVNEDNEIESRGAISVAPTLEDAIKTAILYKMFSRPDKELESKLKKDQEEQNQI